MFQDYQNDFEDAVQYSAGETVSADYLVTRNPSDFLAAALPVVTPEVLLAILTGNNDTIEDQQVM